MSQNTTTYEHYLELMVNPSGMKLQEESADIINRFRGNEQKPTPFAPVSFLLDYTSKKYIYVDEACFNLLGYTASYFLESGVDEYIKKWHPADFEIINRIIFPHNFNFLKKLLPENYADMVFSHNYRIKNAKDEYITVIQRFSFIPGSTIGMPLGVIGVIFDITHFKNDQSIVHTIEEVRKINGESVNVLVYKKTHPVFEIDTLQLMSKRELDVLEFLASGFSSKQIADKLEISINTVNNHRKSMLKKTRCNSSSELMNYAVKHGLV